MTAYLIIEIEVKDKNKYLEYIQKARPIIEKYGGEYLVRGGKITSLTVQWKPERIVIIKFGDKQSIVDCFDSEEYKKIKHLREGSADSRALIIEEDLGQV